jgi:hypothetical protein
MLRINLSLAADKFIRMRINFSACSAEKFIRSAEKFIRSNARLETLPPHRNTTKTASKANNKNQ